MQRFKQALKSQDMFLIGFSNRTQTGYDVLEQERKDILQESISRPDWQETHCVQVLVPIFPKYVTVQVPPLIQDLANSIMP